MSSPPVDEEVAAEQAYLEHALASLGAMRQRAERLLHDLIAAGNPDLDYVASLSRRVSLLADSPRPLLFGRIDEEEGPTWHIGRRHVEDARSDPVVVDWRAPVSVPFYRASARDALGLARRRQIMVDRREVVAVADDLFGGGSEETATTRLRGGDALLAELERARTGEMLDIVATIQAEQDEIIRAPLDLLLTVQGGPGTGKTAVGLHRAAFLLYNHPTLSRDGVLVLGPSRAFLRYIAQVLPSLGEEAVVQTTIADIAPKAKVRLEEPMEVRRIKGDARMGDAPPPRAGGATAHTGQGRQPARALRPGHAERRSGQRARVVHRCPSGPLQGRPSGTTGPARQRGAARLPFVGTLGRRRSLVRTRAHVERRVHRPPRHTVAGGLPHRARA